MVAASSLQDCAGKGVHSCNMYPQECHAKGPRLTAFSSESPLLDPKVPRKKDGPSASGRHEAAVSARHEAAVQQRHEAPQHSFA